MTPQQDKFLFNHTADGFLNLVEQSYNKLIALDGRLTRRLPFSVYLHNMNQLYYVHLITISDTTGQQATWAEKLPSDDFLRLLSGDIVSIPEEIWFWLKGLGQMRDKNGLVWEPNLPYALVPQAARNVNNVAVTGGDFGTPNAENHNAYENHISPHTTRAFVTAMLTDHAVNNVINYDPLPAVLTPADAAPTANFLGYYTNNRRLHNECLSFYDQFANNWSTGDGARIGYNAYLWTKMNAALHSVKDKMKMRTGMPPIDQGSYALYGTIFFNGTAPILRTANGTIESCTEMDPHSLSNAVISAYRRRRDEDRPGYCYLVEGDAPGGWDGTINNEYEMAEPFIPQVGDVNVNLNDINFTRAITEGRYNIILTEITRLTLIPR